MWRKSGSLLSGGSGVLFSCVACMMLAGSWAAAGPVVSVTPPEGALGEAEVTTADVVAATFTVKNTGDEDLVLGTLGVTGADAGMFMIDNDTVSGATLPAESSATVDVEFRPGSTGAKSATLVIPSNIPDAEVPLTGTGISTCAVFMSEDSRLYVVRSNNDGTFGFTDLGSGVGYNTYAVALGDFDGDGDADIVGGSYGGDCIHYYFIENTGNGLFASPVHVATMQPQNRWAMQMAAGDFNNDGALDFIANSDYEATGLFFGNGDGTFTFGKTVACLNAYGRAMDAADFNHDGDLDFARAQYPEGYVYVYLGDGAGSFTMSYALDAGDNPYGVAAGDFDNDGHADIVAHGGAPGGLAWFAKGKGDGTFYSAVREPSLDRVGDYLGFNGAADFDADGKLDIMFYRYGPQDVWVAMGNGDGSFGPATQVNTVGMGRGLGADTLPCQAGAGTPAAAVTPRTAMTSLGAAVDFDASASTDPDGAIASYEWTFGDGATGAGATISHTYTAEGVRRGWVKVTDDSGRVAFAAFTVTVQGEPPAAEANGPYTFGEQYLSNGRWTATLDGSGSGDAESSVTYSWDFGDSASDDFEDGDSSGWTAVSGTWTEADGCFTQSDTSTEYARAMLSSAPTLDDVAVEADVTMLAGSQHVYLFSRSTDVNNWYSFLLRGSGYNDVYISRSINFGVTHLDHRLLPFLVENNRLYHLKLVCKGDRLSGYVDGALVAECQDTFFSAGMSGVSTYRTSARFDNFAAKSIPGTGKMPTHVYRKGPGTYTATLTVTDASGQTDTDTALVHLVYNDPPAADAGGPYSADESKAWGGRWQVQLDGSASTDDVKIVDYAWTVESDDFAGTTIDGRWLQATATQDEVLTLAGGGWGSSYLFNRHRVARAQAGTIDVEATVQMPAIGEVMFGFKNTNDNFSYTQMTYAIYFYSVNSGIGVYEDGTGRGWTGYTFTPGAWYDLRVELKNPGARYYYRPTGTTEWQLVYDSVYSSVTEFYTGLVVTGATTVDNYKLTLHGQKPAARYFDGGVYPVTLTVSDRAGQTATATSTVTITKGLPPVAEAGPDIDLDESQVSGGTWLVLLDGSESTDDYGIYRYDWDFGDGATDSGVMTTHVYSTPGAYTVTLTVWDHALQSSTDTMTVTVTPGEPPVAEAGPDVAMEECDAVSGRWLARFDGSASTDDHWIVRWEWDFGDGQTASGEVVTHVYKAVGEYEVTLTVYDDIPQSDSDTLAVSIEAGEAPEADPGGPYSVQEEDVAAGQALALFDASGSTDDCSIIHYIWDFGTETFDGVYLDKKLWDCSFQIYPGVYGDYVSIWGESWGNRYLFTAHAVDKEPGLTVQARLNESGNTMIGFKHADNQNYSYTDMPYALYLSSGGLHVYEDGAYRVNTGYGYAQSVWYDYKVVINDDGGADYFYKEADAEDWTLVYHSTYVSGASLKSGVVVNDNVCHIDDFRLMAAGRTVIYPVRRPGTVTLTVEDNARQSSTSTAEVSVLGSDAPVADPGGPYTAVFELPVAFDGTRSTDDMGVVKYIWDFGDGSPFGSGPNPEHAYAVGDAIGSVTKTVTLTVYDAAGQSDTQTTTVVLMPGPIVVCVPWQFTGSTEVPHRTWSGKEIRLKGTVKGGIGTLQYTWDFGDGSPATEPATVTDKFVIETAHTYTGTPGTLFTARLTVKDSLENTHHDTYPVVILEDVLDTRVDVAIDEGLWWLHKNQTRAQGDYWDGRIYTYGYPNSETGSAMQAFLINGHKETGSEREDPYVDTVKRGMRMLFRQLAEYSVYSQTYGDPDYPYDGTGNHIGLVSRWSSYMPYEGGMIMDGIVASGTPNRVAWAGNANVAGRTYKEILQDMVDAYAWGQSDNSDCGGGWRYGWNEWPDNSACQWAAIGMIPTTQAPWHCVIPQWVRNRNNVWLSYSYSPENRWFGYTDRGGGNNGSQATRPSGMVQMVMSVDNYKSDSRWIGTEGWFAEAGNWDWFVNCRSYYAWYAFVKAMRLSRSETLSNGFNWFRGSYGVAEKLVGEQESDGTWIEHSQTTHPGNYYDTFVTAWSVIMLTPSLFVLPPVADAGSDVVWKCGLPLTFDGSGSYHLDPTKRIVLYEWDFDGDGRFDYSGDNPVASHTFECVLATYTATLRVTDNEGETDSASRRVTISTEGHAPFAVITVAKLIEGKGVGTAGMPVTLDGTASFDIDDGDTITRYDWVFDGSAGYDFDNPDSTDAVAHAVYETPGTYHVGLRVWDNGVETPENTPMPSVPAYLVIVIDVNEPPSAEAGGPYSVDEGKTLELSGNGSDPNRAEDPLALAWDFDGDGEFDDGVGPNPSASWTGNGTYMVTLQVSDGLLTATDTAEVTVNDLSPTVDFSWSANPAEGSPALFTDASAPAVDAITGWHWDFAGLGASDEQNPSFAFPDDGDYDVTLTVYDTDSSASLAKTVHVAAVGPTANDDSPRVVQDLGAAEIDVLANDTYLPGPAEVLTVVGKTDGQHGTVEITGGGTAVTYTPVKYVGADAFTYTIADEDGVHSTATVHVLVYLRGDADFDCAVTLLDLLLIRNKLNQNVGTGENWRADVNGDGRIDILDLLYTRNRINSKCK